MPYPWNHFFHILVFYILLHNNTIANNIMKCVSPLKKKKVGNPNRADRSQPGELGSLDCEGGRQGTAMGKRKSSAPPPEKKKQKKVPTTFNCPFCEGRKTVGVEL